MTSFPTIIGRDEWDALVIRTDYSDDEAWQAVTAALAEPWDDGAAESCVHIVDDPTWAGASADEVLDVVVADELLGVVFLADRATMLADHNGLLAVTTLTPEDFEDDVDYEEHTRFGREFRIIPREVSNLHANLNLANMDFSEFSSCAGDDPEGVFRGF